MDSVVYRIVEHDGGWAYKLGDVFSETFHTRDEAEAAAARVAAEQHTPGESAAIEWQDEAGEWHAEYESGSDRPDAIVEGQTPERLFQPDTPRAEVPLIGYMLLAGAAGALIALLLRRRRIEA